VTLETCHEDNLAGCIYMEVENASQKMGKMSTRRRKRKNNDMQNNTQKNKIEKQRTSI
jgi:hypothetical protein